MQRMPSTCIHISICVYKYMHRCTFAYTFIYIYISIYICVHLPRKSIHSKDLEIPPKYKPGASYLGKRLIGDLKVWWVLTCVFDFAGDHAVWCGGCASARCLPARLVPMPLSHTPRAAPAAGSAACTARHGTPPPRGSASSCRRAGTMHLFKDPGWLLGLGW